jgi:hypothetical protein
VATAAEPSVDLIVTMDDATSDIYSTFLTEEEGTSSTFRGLHEVIGRHGLFCTFYTDRGSHYFHTPAAGGKIDRARPTPVSRALDQLGIRHIAAYSPEARGRSERMFETLQDRLVKELADAGIATIEAANHYIHRGLSAGPQPALRRPGQRAGIGLRRLDGGGEILCHQEDRVVGNDNTVLFDRLRLQIEPSSIRAHFVKAKVQVRRYTDDTLGLFYGPRCIGRYAPDGALLQTPAKAA